MAPVKKKESNVTPESTSGTLTSENQTPKSLKAVVKITKGPVKESLVKIKEASKSPLVQADESKKKKKRVLVKKKIVSTSNKKEATDMTESREVKVMSIVNGEKKDKGKQVIRIEEKHADSDMKELTEIKGKSIVKGNKKEKGKQVIRIEEKHADSGKTRHNRKNKEKSVGLEKVGSHISKENRGGLQKKQTTEKDKGKRIKLEKNGKSQVNREIRGQRGNQHDKNKKEKLGGLIFMCNAKTKPDCFRYHVMGLPMSKRDLVSGVKPGLKIFLYDFDLKLLYGIYRASTSGGMKLEPAAFDGAFPVQVRFDVHEDCYPLPESVFKRAIKENYNGSNKFKMELSFQQVHKLLKLFRPARVRSRTPPAHPPTIVAVPDREVHNGTREQWENPMRESFVRDPPRSHVEYRENDRHLAYSDVRDVPSTMREGFTHDYYPSEKEYRTHGLVRRERQNLSPRGHGAPTLEPYSIAHVREPTMTQTASLYRDSVVAPGRAASHDPPHLVTEKQVLPYSLVPRWEQQTSTPLVTTALTTTLDTYRKDRYYTHPSSPDPYWLPSRREEPSSLDKYGVLPSRREGTHLGSYHLGGRGESYPSVADGAETRGINLMSQDDNLQRREEVRLGSYSLGGRREVYHPSATTDQLGAREVYLPQTDLSRRGESYLTESSELGRTGRDYARLVYRPHAASDLSDRDQVHLAEASFAPVSSRYSFAGPSRR